VLPEVISKKELSIFTDFCKISESAELVCVDEFAELLKSRVLKTSVVVGDVKFINTRSMQDSSELDPKLYCIGVYPGLPDTLADKFDIIVDPRVQKFAKIEIKTPKTKKTKLIPELLDEQLPHQMDVEFHPGKNDTRLVYLDWVSLFCFPGQNHINFTSLGATGFKAENSRGKTSIIEILLFALYGRKKKELSKIISAGKKKCVVNLIFYSSGVYYRIYRKLTQGDILAHKCVIVKNLKQNTEFTDTLVLHEGIPETGAFIKSIFGSLEQFLTVNVSYLSGYNLLPGPQKKALLQSFSKDPVEETNKKLEAKTNEFLKHITNIEITLNGAAMSYSHTNVGFPKQPSLSITSRTQSFVVDIAMRVAMISLFDLPRILIIDSASSGATLVDFLDSIKSSMYLIISPWSAEIEIKNEDETYEKFASSVHFGDQVQLSERIYNKNKKPTWTCEVCNRIYKFSSQEFIKKHKESPTHLKKLEPSTSKQNDPKKNETQKNQ
jgi:hypothetical protein